MNPEREEKFKCVFWFNSSQTNQTYNQLQAKCDKARMQPLVDLVAKHVGVINQFQLIAIMLAQALKKDQP
jgi:hypothetical protein